MPMVGFAQNHKSLIFRNISKWWLECGSDVAWVCFECGSDVLSDVLQKVWQK